MCSAGIGTPFLSPQGCPCPLQPPVGPGLAGTLAVVSLPLPVQAGTAAASVGSGDKLTERGVHVCACVYVHAAVVTKINLLL